MEPRLFGRAAADEALVKAIERHRAPPLGIALERRGLGPYRGYGEMLAKLRELAHRGGALEVVGKSVRGESIFALAIGNPQAKRTTAILSGIHPMEWIGVETHFTLIERILEQPPTDRRIVSIVIANPDGVQRVESNLRKTRRRFVRHNARRVDLNRNFPSFWGNRSLSRLLLRPVFAAGPSPASEPETRAVVSCFKGRMVDRAVSLHSFGGAVLYPWGARLLPALDVRELRRWAKQVARRADPHRPYRATQSSHWVPGFTAPGMEIDWFYDQHGALSLLVECSRGGFGLARALEPFAWFNPPRPEASAPHVAAALEPFVRGAARPGS